MSLQTDIEDREVIEQWLTGRRGSRVYLRVPKIGSKEKLVELAARNAELILSKDKEHLDYCILCLNRQCNNILIFSIKIGDLLLL